MWKIEVALGFFLLGWNLFHAGGTSTTTTSLRGVGLADNGSRNHTRLSSIDCRIIVLNRLYGENENVITSNDPQMECCRLDENGQEETDNCPSIHLPYDMVERYETQLRHGELIVSISDVEFQNHRAIRYHDPSQIHVKSSQSISNQRQRTRRLRSMGTLSVLTLRVSTTDSAVGFSRTELHNLLFDEERGSVKTQMGNCSAGKLILEPPPAANNTDGVLEVHLPISVGSVDRDEVIEMALNKAKDILELSNIAHAADFIRICLPPGTGNWVAVAAMNHWKSVYNDMQCGYLSVTMHELGHNMGFGHADLVDKPYADSTGYMGGSIQNVREPQRCFSAYNHWKAGWYEDRALDMELRWGGSMVNIAAFVDYDRNEIDENMYILVKVGETIYLQVNKADKYNIGTGMMQNRLLVFEKDGRATKLVEGLDHLHNNLRIPGILDSGTDLVIQVCSVFRPEMGSTSPYHFQVSIGLGEAECSVDSPTMAHSGDHSISPSEGPTGVYSSAPSIIPIPSDSPSIILTVSPSTSDIPSDSPSLLPSAIVVPSEVPSVFPTTIAPSIILSNSISPSTGPSVKPAVASTSASPSKYTESSTPSPTESQPGGSDNALQNAFANNRPLENLSDSTNTNNPPSKATAVPTSSPKEHSLSDQSVSCQDVDSFEFYYLRDLRDCSWIRQHDVHFLCNDFGMISTMCRGTCGGCSE